MEKEKKTKINKIINAVVLFLEIVVIIAGISFSIAIMTGAKSSDTKLGKGYNVSVVLTSSMSGKIDEYKIDSFNAGDLVIIKAVSEKDVTELKIGDVVTYLGLVEGNPQFVTHRIVDKYKKDGDSTETIVTRGDAEIKGAEKKYTLDQIQGKVVFVIPKLGYAINWLQQSKNFLFIIVLPLALLLAYNIAIFIKMVMSAKIKALEEKNKEEIEQAKKKILEDIGEDKPQLDEEEIKKKAIEEYLASMKKESETPGN